MERNHVPRGALLTSNLPQLQNLIKRDPAAYKEEFLQQWNHYESIRKIFQINPDEQAQQFRQLISFIAQVAQCYPQETADFPNRLSALLLESYSTLNPDTRKTLVQNLVMLRNKSVITSIEQRGMDGEVLGDKGKLRVGTTVVDASSKQSADEAMWAVVMAKELWKKGVWNDAKTVSIVALGCFHPHTKVQSASLHFFLGSDEEEEEESDEDDIPDVKALHHRREVNKKTRSSEKKLAKTLKSARKKRKEKNAESATPNFPALQLLNDPQTFGEKLYDNLSRYDKRYSLDHKILLMQLLSRVMGAHQLCILGFYNYIIKYLTYHQLRIPAILVSLAQSVHSLTPPDALTPVIRKIANEFVHPGVGPEVIAAGLNSIREVCRRQPWCMEEDLLGDLIEYRKSRDKGVMTASRGLLQLYREVNPGMLKRRERGKEATMSKDLQRPAFGHTNSAAVDIEGLELLEAHFEKLRAEDDGNGVEVNEEDDEAAWEGWEVDSETSDSESEGWIDVSSDDEDDIVISDSEDESTKKGKRKDKKEADESMETDPPEVIESVPRTSTLATTKASILTPADFALLNDLKIKAATEAVQAGAGPATKRKLAALEANKKSISNKESGNLSEFFVSENDILGPRKKAKADYEERMASIQKGREGREKFGSARGKKKKETPSSSTNREKARNKPLMMILASNAVRGKKKASLREKQKKLRAHINRAKKS
ncbi:hypothetical protein Clacol_001975 [Clathrus columnatus]|uniref:Protein SDA1 n=1 Tax=Clathrus columnatus TaxID=1419009 RepID=A0AAV5A0J9_9AGAM|nr:hypothetical protein Clacol_001975 [Clathrus columnatus]